MGTAVLVARKDPAAASGEASAHSPSRSGHSASVSGICSIPTRVTNAEGARARLDKRQRRKACGSREEGRLREQRGGAPEPGTGGRAARAGGHGKRARQTEGQRVQRLRDPGERCTCRICSEMQVCSAPRSPVTLSLNLSLPSRPEATAAPPAFLVPVRMPITSPRVPTRPGGRGWPLPPHFNLQWARHMPDTGSLPCKVRGDGNLPFHHLAQGAGGQSGTSWLFWSRETSDLKAPTAEAGEGPSKQSEQPWERQSETEGDRRPHSRGDSTQTRRRSRGPGRPHLL